MPFCTSCGNEVKDGAKFCGSCGAAAGGAPTSAPVSIDLDNEDTFLDEEYGKVSDTWAWVLACVPVIGLLIQLMFGLDATIRFIVFFVMNTVCWVLDYIELKKKGRADGWTFFGAVLVPIYLFVRASKIRKKYGYAITWCVLFVVMLFLDGTITGTQSIGESKYVTMVKHGSMESCPNSTVNNMVKSFFGNPKWKHIVAADGNNYVNIEGGMTYADKPVRGVLQLWVRDERFGFNAFEINGVPQNGFIAAILVNNMCEAAAGTVSLPSESSSSQSQSSTDIDAILAGVDALKADDGGKPNAGNRDSRLVGIWVSERCINYNNTYVFQADGRGESRYDGGEETFTWHTSDNKISIEKNNPYTYSIFGSKLTINKTVYYPDFAGGGSGEQTCIYKKSSIIPEYKTAEEYYNDDYCCYE